MAIRCSLLSALLLVTASGQAQPPRPDDFARGIPLTTSEAANAYQLRMPEAVYGLITDPALGDLRVFDSRGQVVQHALCPVTDQQRLIRESHPVAHYGLPAGQQPAELLGGRLAIETAAGARIELAEGERASQEERPGALEYILDLRPLDVPISALTLDWQWRSPQGRAEIPLAIQASNDLDQWHTVLTKTTLLRVADNGPETASIALPQRHYAFLRLTPQDNRVRDWLASATAISQQPTLEPAALIWKAAQPLAAPQTAGVYELFSQRPAPLQQLRVQLPDDNLHLQLAISARPAGSDHWRLQRRATISGNGDDGNGATVALNGSLDKTWRIEITDGVEALGKRPLRIEFGYRPMQLGFLAQGQPPYLLAFASRQVPLAKPLPCDALGEQPAAAEAQTEQLLSLGGDQRLQPPAQPLPWRLILLWGLLVAGALLVIVMALSLLRGRR